MKPGPKPGSKLRCSVCQQTGHTARTHSGRAPRTTLKAHSIYKFYRLRWADYLAWLENGCAICRCDLHDRTPDIDHDHACEHPDKGLASCRACVRGLLCRSCNLRVGAFERGQNDDADIRAYLGMLRVAVRGFTQGSLFSGADTGLEAS